MSVGELPQGWVETKLGEVVDYGKTTKAEPQDIKSDTWVLELEDVEKDSSKILQKLYFSERQSKSTKNRFNKGDVLYGKLRPYLSKIVMASDDGVCTTEIVPLNGGELVDNKYLFYWLKGSVFKDYVDAVSYGVNMPRLGTKDGLDAPFIFISLAEQQQIAAKLDELLAQVDSLKTRLDAIPNILKRFRQSVLAAAVSGKLTEDWRETQNLTTSVNHYNKIVKLPTNYIRAGKQKITGCLDFSRAWIPNLPETWCYKTVDQLYSTNHIFEYIDGNHGSLYPRKEDFSDKGVLFLTATQIKNTKIFWSEVPRLQEDKASLLVKGWAKAGDVLLTHNATVGRVAKVDDNFEELFLLGTSVTLYRTTDLYINRSYLFYFFESRIWQTQLESVMEQSTRDQVSITKQALMQIALPPVVEQGEIAKRVAQLLAYADQIEQRVKDAQSRVNHLTQSILAKAFRGELTAEWREQNPDLISGENSAEALLARIQAEREASGKVTKRSRKVV